MIIALKENSKKQIVLKMAINDNRLSLASKGLLFLFLSNNEDLNSKSELFDYSSNGTQSSNTAFQELIEFGYVTAKWFEYLHENKKKYRRKMYFISEDIFNKK